MGGLCVWGGGVTCRVAGMLLPEMDMLCQVGLMLRCQCDYYHRYFHLLYHRGASVLCCTPGLPPARLPLRRSGLCLPLGPAPAPLPAARRRRGLLKSSEV